MAAVAEEKRKGPRSLFLIPPSGGMQRDVSYGCWHAPKFIGYGWPPTSLMYAAATAERFGPAAIMDFSAAAFESALERAAGFAPDFIFICSDGGAALAESDAAFVRALKKAAPPGARAVFFSSSSAGALPGRLPAGIDYSLAGDVEASLPRFLARRPFSRRKPAYCMELDRLPFAARHLVDHSAYRNPLALEAPFTTMLASRGCPHSCAFCSARRTPFRCRSPGNVIAEMESARSQGFKEIFFRDENIALSRPFIEGLCDGLAGRDMSWMANARVDSVDEPLLRLMAKAGCHMLKFGVESGRQEELDRMGKGTTVARIRRAFAGCRAAGIETVAHMMIGLPWQTAGDAEAAADFALSLGPTFASFDIFVPQPGTPLAGARPSAAAAAGYKRAFRRFYLNAGTIARAASTVRSWKRLRDYAAATAELWAGLLPWS